MVRRISSCRGEGKSRERDRELLETSLSIGVLRALRCGQTSSRTPVQTTGCLNGCIGSSFLPARVRGSERFDVKRRHLAVAVFGLWQVCVFWLQRHKGTCRLGCVDSGFSLPPIPLSPLAACLELAGAEASFEVRCGRLAQADVGDSASGYIGTQCPPSLFAAEEAAYKAGTLAYSGGTVSCMVNALVPDSGSAIIPCNTGYPELNPVCGQLAWGTLGPGQPCTDPYRLWTGLLLSPSAAGSARWTSAWETPVATPRMEPSAAAACATGRSAPPSSAPVKFCELSPLFCRLPAHLSRRRRLSSPLGVDGGCNGSVDSPRRPLLQRIFIALLPGPRGWRRLLGAALRDGFRLHGRGWGLPVCAADSRRSLRLHGWRARSVGSSRPLSGDGGLRRALVDRRGLWGLQRLRAGSLPGWDLPAVAGRLALCHREPVPERGLRHRHQSDLRLGLRVTRVSRPVSSRCDQQVRFSGHSPLEEGVPPSLPGR